MMRGWPGPKGDHDDHGGGGSRAREGHHYDEGVVPGPKGGHHYDEGVVPGPKGGHHDGGGPGPEAPS